MPMKKFVDDGPADDAEGNMPLRRGVESGDASHDTDGNAAKYRGVDSGEDDTEGNALRSGRAAKAGRSEQDDTGGNLARSGRAAPNDARPNR
jgi:hypothetical protein